MECLSTEMVKQIAEQAKGEKLILPKNNKMKS